MPCDIGYRNVTRVRIPVPQPQKFKSKSKAPKVDADLLAKLGQDDPEFLDWLTGLDIKPLIEEALKRALAKVDGGGVGFSIGRGGDLVAEAEYRNDKAKKKIEKAVASVSARWQMEVLGVVAQLLDFAFVIRASGSGSLTLEGEKDNGTGVHEYIRVDNLADGASIRFEHYKSPADLEKDKTKFLALAQKLGVKISVIDSEDAGQPIPQGVVHQDFLREKE
jgi:hypothetical protein